MANAIVSRTLSVHKEHEVLLKLEAAGLDDDLAQQIIDSKNNELGRSMIQFARDGGALVEKPAAKAEPPQPIQQPQVPTHPPIGEWFDLEIDGDLDITPSGWKPLGPAFPKGKRTYRAKLIELGYQPNLEAARTATKVKEPKCVMAPGQARESFAAKYPRHSGRPVVMGGNEWRDSYRYRRVACLGFWHGGSAWDPGFRFSLSGFDGRCLWLVLEQVDA